MRIEQKVVAFAGACVAAVVFLSVLMHRQSVMGEPDLMWHVKTGLVTLQQHAVPQTDQFSFTQAGRPWIAKEWLSQVLYALAYDAAGWAGPLMLGAAATALAGALLFMFNARAIRPHLAVFLALVGLFFSSEIISIRPHLLVLPVLVYLTGHIFSAARALTWPSWWTLVLVVIWTNLHASFPFVFAIAGCGFIEFLWRGGYRMRGPALRWIIYLGAAVVATLLNPYFLKPYLIAADLAKGIDVMNVITEWQPFQAPKSPAIEAEFLAVFFALLMLRPKLGLGQVIFILLCAHMMLMHLRFIYLFFLLAPLVAVPEIVAENPAISAKGWMLAARDGLENFLGRRPVAAVGALAIACLAYVGYLAQKGKVDMLESVALPGAMAFAKDHMAAQPALQKNVFNDYNFGGTLILNGIKTFIDGRADQLFLGDFIKSYVESTSNEKTFNTILDDHKIGWTLFEPKDLRNTFLSRLPGWEKAYADDFAVIYERKDVSGL